jgi:hypothetical protein
VDRHHFGIVDVMFVVVVVMMPVFRVYKINVIVIEDKGYSTIFYGVGI